MQLNQLYATDFKTKRRFKTEKYTEFEQEMAYLNKQQHLQMSVIKNNFNEKTQYIEMDYRFFYPIKKKDGSISKTAGDTTNCFKSIEDCIFSYLKINDAYVLNVSGKRIHSTDIYTEIDVYIRNL
jgi:Holliday junction resolvase RusA-like endonuclease